MIFCQSECCALRIAHVTSKGPANRRVNLQASCVREVRGGDESMFLFALRQGLSLRELLEIAFLFFDCRGCEAAVKLSQ